MAQNDLLLNYLERMITILNAPVLTDDHEAVCIEMDDIWRRMTEEDRNVVNELCKHLSR